MACGGAGLRPRSPGTRLLNSGISCLGLSPDSPFVGVVALAWSGSPFVIEHRDKKGAEGECPPRERVPTHQEHGGQRNRDPLKARSSQAASCKGERADGDDPPESPRNAECEDRPHAGPVLDHGEDAFLLCSRQITRGMHCQPRADSGESVVRTEEDQETPN